jgi:hypothetical protein
MKAAIKAIVDGRTVYDLGAGDISNALTLLELGAEHVTCVDRNPPPFRDGLKLAMKPGLSWRKRYFAELHSDIIGDGMADLNEVLFISWPVNWMTALDALVRLHRDAWIIYVGSNRNGAACGSCEMFFEMTKRDVQVEIQHPRNDLIIYKPGRRDHHRYEKGTLTRDELGYAERVEYEWSDRRIAFQLMMP